MHLFSSDLRVVFKPMAKRMVCIGPGGFRIGPFMGAQFLLVNGFIVCSVRHAIVIIARTLVFWIQRTNTMGVQIAFVSTCCGATTVRARACLAGVACGLWR